MDRVAQRAAVGRFVGTARYEGAAAGGLLVGGLGTTQCALICRKALTTSDGDIGGPYQAGANGGWGFRLMNSGADLRYIRVDGAGNARQSIVSPSWPALIGRYLLLIGKTAADGSQELYVHGLTSGVVANAGYTAPTTKMTVGNRPSSYNTPLLTIGVTAIWGSDNYLLPDADRASYTAEVINAIEQGRDIPFFRTETPGEDELWDARDVVIGGGGTRATWTGRISGTELTKSGTVNAYSFAGRGP